MLNVESRREKKIMNKKFPVIPGTIKADLWSNKRSRNQQLLFYIIVLEAKVEKLKPYDFYGQ